MNSSAAPSPDAIVLGAGIIGAACACELVRAGLQVTLIDRHAVLSGATAAGMGHIVLMDDSPAQFALTRYAQSLWSDLAPSLPEAAEYRRRGTIWVATDEQELAEARRKLTLLHAHGLEAELLDPAALAEAEPNLSPALAGGLLVPSDAVLYPPAATAYLIEEARRHGCELLFDAVLSAADGSVQLRSGTTLHAPVIVNAAGALSPLISHGLEVRPRKGHLLLTDPYPGLLHHQLVELGYLKSAHAPTSADSVAFNVQPRVNGQIVIGSSRQYGSEDTGIDGHIVDAMLARAALFMPILPTLSVARTWAGFRAATPDKLPLIGPTEDPTVFVATGHEGLGITTSLATGRLLADSVLRRSSAIPLYPYLPSRLTHTATPHTGIQEQL